MSCRRPAFCAGGRPSAPSIGAEAFCLLDGGLLALGHGAPGIFRVSHSTHTYLPGVFPLALIECSICVPAGRLGLPSYSTSKGYLPIAQSVASFLLVRW